MSEERPEQTKNEEMMSILSIKAFSICFNELSQKIIISLITNYD